MILTLVADGGRFPSNVTRPVADAPLVVVITTLDRSSPPTETGTDANSAPPVSSTLVVNEIESPTGIVLTVIDRTCRV
jgi:hypothetical protein